MSQPAVSAPNAVSQCRSPSSHRTDLNGRRGERGRQRRRRVVLQRVGRVGDHRRGKRERQSDPGRRHAGEATSGPDRPGGHGRPAGLPFRLGTWAGLSLRATMGPMRITAVASTDLFTGSAQRPLQIIQVTLVNEGLGLITDPGTPVEIRVDGPGVTTPAPARVTGLEPGGTLTAEVPVEFAAPYQAGSLRTVTAVAVAAGAARRAGAAPRAGARRAATGTGDAQARLEAKVTAAEPGWTMWMVSHFHYDPVWWGTQGQFTESRLLLPDADGQLPDVRTAFELVRLHLDRAREDPDYKFVLAEIDYLKPHFDAYPEDRADLRRFIADGRVEIVGGNYNEPNTNLTGAEATIRNAVLGIGFQRDVLGGDPRTAWMLDVFGHDPGYPGLMAAAGLTSSSWARGPFHQWGPSGTEGGNRRMQFASEFEWMSPDGRGLLTSYMANHYGAGWRMQRLPDLAAAETEAYGQFRSLAEVAATRNVHAAGRLRPRDPAALGDRDPPRLERPLRLAEVRDRRAGRFLRGRPVRRRGHRGVDHAAEPGHEPDLHRQGRLLHRHQAGAARGRSRLPGRRAAGHARLAGRRAVPGRVDRQGVAPDCLRRPSRRDHRHRGRPGLSRSAGRLAGGLGTRRRGPRRGRPAPRGRARRGRCGDRARLGNDAVRLQHPVPAAVRHGPVHADDRRTRYRTDCGARSRRCGASRTGRGHPAAPRPLAGRGDPDLPRRGRAGRRLPRLLGVGGTGPGRPAGGAGRGGGRAGAGRMGRNARHDDRERDVPGDGRPGPRRDA